MFGRVCEVHHEPPATFDVVARWLLSAAADGFPRLPPLAGFPEGWGMECPYGERRCGMQRGPLAVPPPVGAGPLARAGGIVVRLE